MEEAVLFSPRLFSHATAGLESAYDEDGLEARDLSFSWHVTRSSDIAVEIKLNFSSPIEVSRLPEGPDELMISFTPNEEF